MRVFVVHAHHEPTSFNGALTREAVASLGAAGHEVVVSDLYAMGFDPVSDRRNFRTVRDPERLKQQNEESHASACDGYVGELQAEMDKLAWCDALVLQFPPDRRTTAARNRPPLDTRAVVEYDGRHTNAYG